VFSWLVMALLVVVSWWITRRLTAAAGEIGRGQNVLEAVVAFMLDQIREVTNQDPEPYLPFVGTLFLFIVTSNVLSVVPGFEPPTGSLTTTAALAVCVFVAVPAFGVAKLGLRAYLGNYLRPSPFLLPFTSSASSHAHARARRPPVRQRHEHERHRRHPLSVVPLFFPVVMQAFGLLIGVIQAYIFAILAIVYIASGTEHRDRRVAARGGGAHERLRSHRHGLDPHRGPTIAIGSIGPALGEGRALAQALQLDRPAARRGEHDHAHALRGYGDGRVHRHLLLRRVADPHLRQPVLGRGPERVVSAPRLAREPRERALGGWGGSRVGGQHGDRLFTLIAQIVNFVVLLVLLRCSSTAPSMRVMREREQRIVDEHAAAEAAREEAEARAEELQRERAELEEARRERLAEVEREAEAVREERLAEAREEAEEARERWREALERERDELADAVRGRRRGGAPTRCGGAGASWPTRSSRRERSRSSPPPGRVG
jgi:F-type H+-transporting ATPase subunit a